MNISKEFLIGIQTSQREKGYKNRESSPTHLNSAIVEWSIEDYWNRKEASILTYENKGFVFLLHTYQKDINGIDRDYCEIRHIVTLEQFRGQKVGSKLVQLTEEYMRERKYKQLKVLSDIASSNFYLRIGFQPSGITKHGLSYFCRNIENKTKGDIPASDFPYLVNNSKSIL